MLEGVSLRISISGWRQRSADGSQTVVTAAVRRRASTMRQLACRVHLGVGRCIAISATFGTFGVKSTHSDFCCQKSH